MRHVVRLADAARRLFIAAVRSLWQVLCLPFIAFEAMGSRLVPAPRDDAAPREDLRRERDLQIKKMLHTPPPQG
jgi:hypothetical protein